MTPVKLNKTSDGTDIAISTFNLSFVTSTPRLNARSAPNVSKSKSFADLNNTIKLIMKHVKTSSMDSYLHPAKLPKINWNTDFVYVGSIIIMIYKIPLSDVENKTPVITSVCYCNVVSIRYPINHTIHRDLSPAMTPNSGTKNTDALK